MAVGLLMLRMLCMLWVLRVLWEHLLHLLLLWPLVRMS